MVDRASDRPVYKQVADLLRDSIAKGELAPGTSLPSEAALIQQFEVSRNTVRLAVAQLRAEGIVATEHGRGTYVRPRQQLRRLSSTRYSRAKREARRAPLTAEAQEQGATSGQDLREVTVVDAPPEIAKRLRIDRGTPVVVRRHLLSLDQEPIQTADSYFPLDIAQGTIIAEPRKIDGGVHAFLELDLGYELAKFVEELTFRMPSPQEARLFRIGLGVPMVRLLRTLLDKSERPLEVSDFLLVGDRHELVYEVPAG